MSFLDTIKDRLRGGSDDYYDDDYYEDESYEDDGYQRDDRRRDTGSSGHLLGTTPRPEAESVSVYTRSGRPVASQQQPAPRSYADPTPVAAPEPPRSTSSYGYEQPTQVTAPVTGTQGARVASAQLPPYVLKPVSYDDVQTVVRRVRTNQPVVVSFRGTNIDCAKRILDFCFGFSYGINGEVRELGDRVFCVLPSGMDLSQADIDKLVADGELTR